MHGFDKFAKDMKQKYGFTPLQISLHCDEGHVENEVVKLNVHAHVTFFNYDFEKERSVLRNLHKQDFRDIQDLAQKSFQSVNLDFKRGVGKEITGKKHGVAGVHTISANFLQLVVPAGSSYNHGNPGFETFINITDHNSRHRKLNGSIAARELVPLFVPVIFIINGQADGVSVLSCDFFNFVSHFSITQERYLHMW